MCIAANKIPGIYAADCFDSASAFFARTDEDVNVICLGTRWISEVMAKRIVKTWLETPFGEGRHARRMNKIKAMERAWRRTK